MKTLAEAADQYLLRCQDLSAATRIKYRNVLRNLLAFCQGEGATRLAELSVEMLDRYRAWRNIGRLTALKELQTLRPFRGFRVDRGWLRGNPAKRIKAPSAQPEPVEPYSPEELGKILARISHHLTTEAHDRPAITLLRWLAVLNVPSSTPVLVKRRAPRTDAPLTHFASPSDEKSGLGACESFGRSSYERRRAKAMILLLRHTALRISDVATLSRGRIQKGEMFLHTFKTGGLVKLPVPADLQAALEAVPSSKSATEDVGAYFFWNGVTGREAVIRNVRRTLGVVFRKAGIRQARTHRFRHPLATDILTQGGSIQDVADVPGISPGIAQRHYTKWTQARQDRIGSIMHAVQTARDSVSFGTNLAQSRNTRTIR